MDHWIEVIFALDSDDSDVERMINQSSSSSDDDLPILIMSKKRRNLHRIPRIQNYVERTVSNYNAEQFKSNFRLLPETFEFILGLIGPKISTTTTLSGKKPIDGKKQFLLTLWVMATPDSYRSVCEKFDDGKATAIRSVRRVSHALFCLAPRFIKWPMGTQAVDVMREYEQYSGFPQIIGAIDGTHIRIKSPKMDSQSYISFYSSTGCLYTQHDVYQHLCRECWKRS